MLWAFGRSQHQELLQAEWQCSVQQQAHHEWREEGAGRHISSASISNTCFLTVQMELGTYPEPIQAVLQKLLAAASPSAPVPMHWRYSLMSLAVFLFIMPPVDAASAKVCIACACVSQLSMTQFPCTPSRAFCGLPSAVAPL